MRIKRIPRALAHPYAPTLVTKPTETTPNAEAVPARPGADRHALDHKPPGVSSIARVSSTRADRARPMATRPTIRGDAGFSLDARRGRDRIT